MIESNQMLLGIEEKAAELLRAKTERGVLHMQHDVMGKSHQQQRATAAERRLVDKAAFERSLAKTAQKLKAAQRRQEKPLEVMELRTCVCATQRP